MDMKKKYCVLLILEAKLGKEEPLKQVLMNVVVPSRSENI